MFVALRHASRIVTTMTLWQTRPMTHRSDDIGGYFWQRTSQACKLAATTDG
jgi:hypothetical protein